MCQRVLIIFLLATTININAQKHWCDSVSASADFSVSVSSNSKLNPLWLYSNQWGIYTQYKQFEALAHAKANVRLANFRHFDMNLGVGGVATTDDGRSMLHEAYIAGKVYIFDYTIGMQARSPFAQYDYLNSGNYLMSSNARPYPRIGVGLFDYWSVPYTRDWLQIKGGFYIGRLLNEYDANDEFKNSYTRDVMLSEKFAFVRLGGWNVKPYFGLLHSVMMGGTLPDGTDIPTDFWASFFAKGSEKFRSIGVLRGEATNAAGAHQGLWDMGIDFEFDEIKGALYLQRMFRDNAGTKPFSEFNKDFILGGRIELNNKWLQAISAEYFKTSYQSGSGTPDPIGYDKSGNLIAVYPGDYPSDEEGFQKWLKQHFTDEDITTWEAEHDATVNASTANWFLRTFWDCGAYGGRKNYLDNGLYMQGWSQGGLSMGTALFHSKITASKYIPDGQTTPGLNFFANSRVEALTLGVDGIIIPNKLTYLLKYTASKNHGSLSEKYNGSFGLSVVENYFYLTSKMEYYSLLKLNYVHNNQWSGNLSMAYDYGDLYKSFGIRVGVSYKLGKSVRR